MVIIISMIPPDTTEDKNCFKIRFNANLPLSSFAIVINVTRQDDKVEARNTKRKTVPAVIEANNSPLPSLNNKIPSFLISEKITPDPACSGAPIKFINGAIKDVRYDKTPV